jgi:hypothetical protein
VKRVYASVALAAVAEGKQEVIIHDVSPKWFCRCLTPDGMKWHELDERACPVCGARRPQT